MSKAREKSEKSDREAADEQRTSSEFSPEWEAKGLQVEEDFAFQRKQWVLERVGWVVMALIVAAAFAGLLGPGPVNSATAGDPNGPLSVEYSRFPRHASPGLLMSVRVGPARTGGEDVRVWVDSQYFEKFRVERIEPEPERVEAASGRYTYVFPLAERNMELKIAFHLEPEGYGPADARVGVVGAEQDVAFHQFIYP